MLTGFKTLYSKIATYINSILVQTKAHNKIMFTQPETYNKVMGLEKKKQEMIINQKLKIHDRLCDYVDKLLKEHNPCKIKNGKCARGKFCCDYCKYLNEDGCTIKCLGCKLWLCPYLVSLPECQSLLLKLNKIRRVALRKGLIINRGPKEDLLLHRNRYAITRSNMAQEK